MAILSLDPSSTVGVGCHIRSLYIFFCLLRKRSIGKRHHEGGQFVLGTSPVLCDFPLGRPFGFFLHMLRITGAHTFCRTFKVIPHVSGVLPAVLGGVRGAIRLAAGRADGRCHAGGGAAGMLMQLQHLIRTIIRNSIRGIVGLEAVFIRFFNTVPRYNRHRVPCGGSVGSRDADGRSGQGLFDDDGSESTVVIIQVNIVFASALFTIALPVAGNIDIAANGQSARIRNINTARFSSLRYAVIGNTAAVDANVIAGRVYSSAAIIGVVFGNAAAVHGEIRGITARAHSTAIVGLVLGDFTAVHGEGRSAVYIHSAAKCRGTSKRISGNASAIHGETCILIQIHSTTLILGNTTVVHDEYLLFSRGIIQVHTHTRTAAILRMSDFTPAFAVAESKGYIFVPRRLNYMRIVVTNRMSVKA